MNELFTQIIIGEKEIKDLEKENTGTSKKVANTNDIAKYFLKTARRKYNDEKIEKKDIKKLLYVYNDLISENSTVKKYINSKNSDEELLKEAEHIMKLFVDDFVKDKKSRKTTSKSASKTKKRGKNSKKEENVLFVEVKVAGFVEPILLSLITLGMGFIFLGNLYLYFY